MGNCKFQGLRFRLAGLGCRLEGAGGERCWLRFSGYSYLASFETWISYGLAQVDGLGAVLRFGTELRRWEYLTSSSLP